MSNNSVTQLLQSIQTSQISQQLKVPHDAVIVILHYALLSEGFECIGLESDALPNATNVMPSNWNKSKDVYAFKYRHSLAPNKTFILKCLTLGKQLLVHATCLEQSNNMCSCDVNTSDLLNEAALQQFIQGGCSSESTQFSSFVKQGEALTKLLNTIKSQITRKLVPQINDNQQQQQANNDKLPSTITIPQQAQKSSSLQVQPQQQQPPPQAQPPQYYPPQPNYYDDDVHDVDPLRIGRPQRGGRYMGSNVDPFGGMGIGGNDLMPNLPPPTFGGFGSGGRSSGFGPTGGSGNLIGPHHPGFGIPPSFGNVPSGVPPGARFDPYGPPNPYGGAGRGRGLPPQPNPQNPPPNPQNLPQSNPNQFQPDPDHEKPPGNNDNPYFM